MSVLFCDMDGVLADFETAFKAYSGITTEGWFDISGKEWFQLQSDWPTFWSDLEMMPFAKDLWAVIHPYHPTLLTAVPNEWLSAGTGKGIWASRMLPGFGTHRNEKILAVRREQKRLYAKSADGTPNILIDDLDKNINEWRQAGGLGVHYIPSGSMIRKIADIMKRVLL